MDLPFPRQVLGDHEVESVVLLGTGVDNVAYEVNGELIVRVARDPRLPEREARLLTFLTAVSPLPVPRPLFAGEGCLVYRKLPGTPLLDLASFDPAPVVDVLGSFLSALHSLPVPDLVGLVDTDVQPLSEWLTDAAALYPRVASAVPSSYRHAMESFLDTAPPVADFAPVFSHNDLGIEHVLFDPLDATVTGIIDWSDAAIVDPAYDFGLLYRDLGPFALDPTLAARAVFYARCSVLEDLAYGLDTGRQPYVDKSLAALEWLFQPYRLENGWRGGRSGGRVMGWR
jgi:aminoglycoside phosphotransferase (APT) family kinase protein